MSKRPGVPNLIIAAESSRPSAGDDGSAPASAQSTPGSTPAPNEWGPPLGIQKMKFKPKVPIRRPKSEVEVKTEQAAPAALPATRGGASSRGRDSSERGRGRAGGRGAPLVSASVAAGVFGGPRPVASSSRKFTAVAPTNTAEYPSDPEVYSDHSEEDGLPSGGHPVDIDLVSTLSELAPTSLYRDRKLTQGKEKGEKVDRNSKLKDRKGKFSAPILAIKDEPVSPGRKESHLRGDNGKVSEDKHQNLDERGRRVRDFMQTGGNEKPEAEEVNTAQAIDLSESEDEEEEEDIEHDFIVTDGSDDPKSKLFMFQFPHLFPKFHPWGPVDLSIDEDIKPDIRSAAAQSKARKLAQNQSSEGRVGTMVVMKSGKVKMVFGNDIVMNVAPGVPTTFTQQFVHLDAKKKDAIVVGDVHKNYVVTPDIDRLLQDLYIHGGQTPGDKEGEIRKRSVLIKDW
ncbi:hypothetical protein L204_101266 [Cryptococcus depauperatus]